MKVYKYKDYDHYVERQTFYNKKKLHWVLIKEEHIEWMVSRCSFPSTVICHGTRNGIERQLFKKYTGTSSYVIGTEIRKLDPTDDGYRFRWILSQSGHFDYDRQLSTPKKYYWIDPNV